MNKNDTLKSDVLTSQDLTAGALSYTTSIGRKFRLVSISFKASENITETITITKDSVQGANYDIILRQISLSAQQNFVYRPDGDEDFQSGDEIKIQCTNANITGIIRAVIKTRELE